MKTLLTLINEYKQEPSDALQKIIWKFIMNKELISTKKTGEMSTSEQEGYYI